MSPLWRIVHLSLQDRSSARRPETTDVQVRRCADGTVGGRIFQ
jgi:hypothetical protein